MSAVYTIRRAGAGESIRLDELLRQELPRLVGKPVSNSKIRRLIVAGAVQVDGLQRRLPAFIIKTKSVVTVSVDEEKLFYEKDAGDISFELTDSDVLYEDDVIIVVNKPSLFPTEAGMVASRDNMHAAVVRYLWKKNPALRNPPYAGIMHRLDRETSGVILFTKQRSVNAACHDMFEKHTARKVYRAVSLISAAGKPVRAGAEFPVEMPMGRISGKSQAAAWGRVPESKGGVASHTDFTVLSVRQEAKRLRVYIEARPLTGRTHQIRVHLSSVSLPILGDTLYGGSPAARIHLHALSLTFPHPLTGTLMTVSAPLPPEFEAD
ncbi:MAG: RluA family pseudouridine synthase [Treponema sp.]|nr:RluA family pseudouridine synthase [Treponema sp.]